MWEYTDKVKEYFLKPKNVGEVENPDAVGEVGSIVCGDALRLSLKVDKETNRIVDAKFQTFGCASAIASSSVITELVKGKTLDEAAKITNQDIADYLGGLPDEKMHCSVMGMEALEDAINKYRGVKKVLRPEENIICKCFDVSEEKIRRTAIENHLKTVEDITHYTKAGGGCGMCIPEIEQILKEVWSITEIKERPVEKKKLTNIQRMALIQDILEREIRPKLQADGGDLDLVDIDGSRVIVGLRGMCVDCPSGSMTIKGIEARLKDVTGQDITVVTE
jgi:NifU-like protein